MTRLVCLAMLTTISLAEALPIPSPLFLDPEGRLVGAERTVCGDDELLPMAEQSEATQRLGKPIGFVKITMSNGWGACSGTLVGKDLFLTAQHCEGACSDMAVTFGFLESRQETFRCKEIVEKGDGSIAKDYLVLRLEGSPGVAWGWYPLSDEPLEVERPLLMIHHPEARPMQLSQEAECRITGFEYDMMQHRCDTMSGSSGSGILTRETDPEKVRVVGIHTLGGCDSSNGANSGVAVATLAPKSALIRSLVKK